jgi:hypothetical protein
LRHKSIPDALSDLSAIVESMIAAHEDDGSTGSHGRFLFLTMLMDNLDMLSERVKVKPAT